MKPAVVIVSPALADANNGNWQTAHRWQKLLRAEFSVRIVDHWPDGTGAAQDACMLALHARRSAPSVLAWAQRGVQPAADGPAPGLAVVLTGTDLYRDIQTDAQAQRSLQLAQRLVLLQERAPDALPAPLRARASVIFQSTARRQTLYKMPVEKGLRAVMVGHLREEKSPETLFDAARLFTVKDRIHLDHIGAGLDRTLAAQAQATAIACPHYRWLGGLPHEATRKRIQRAHVLVHTSRMEGGAHVVMESVCSGTPVLASRIAGNVGMLGADYAGYFDWGDAQALAALLRQCQNSPPFYALLQSQCAARAALFLPQAEQTALVALVRSLVGTP